MSRSHLIVFGVVLALSSVLGGVEGEESRNQEQARGATEPKVIAAAEMQWKDAPSLPAGAQTVVLDGDPAKEGPFTLRLKIRPGYRIPPHTHPTAERVTVISGAVRLGFGKVFDENAGREMKAGDFVVVPPGVPHFASSSGEAVLQIHGEGPFQRSFVDPAPDGANTKK